MPETTWARSVYLYVMCAVSIALVGFGSVAFAIGLVHTVAPDLGHRDTLDRIGIGLSNVGSEVVGLMDDTQLRGIEEYCEDVTTGNREFEDCLEEEQSFQDDSFGAINDGIREVRDELRTQIRNNSIDRMIRGLLLVGAGVLLFRIHGRRTELFADGLVPRPPAAPAAATEPAPGTTEPAPAAVPPPPPPAL